VPPADFSHLMNAETLLERLALTPLERNLVMLRYSEQLSIEEIAIVLDMTRHRVATLLRQIVARAERAIEGDDQLTAGLAPRSPR
jgi:DNA-directed RNA polymerase specialized sigma24 family protein